VIHVKGAISTLFRVFVASLFLLLVPAAILAESRQSSQGLPPVAQALIREGTVATQLAGALNPDSVKSDEAEAESWLGDKGISPINGWIADYPVTPVIMSELQESLGKAADGRKISLSRDEALKLLDSITRELAIVSTSPGDSGPGPAAPEGEMLIAPTAVYDYYTEVGPPVVTYYAPPSDYYYLYSWVPYPFWCGGFSFGGFFILNDFHRTVFFDRFHDHGLHNRAFVSNHFRDRITNRVTRIEPGVRSGGRFSGNSGAFTRQSPAASGVQGGIRSGFTSQRAQQPPAALRSGPLNSASFQGMRSRPEGVVVGRQTGGVNVSRSFSSPVRGSEAVSSFSSSGRTFESGRSLSTPVRSFGSANSSMSSFRSGGGGYGGGFSRQGGGGFSGGHGGRR
jgi:hypothetical protein